MHCSLCSPVCSCAEGEKPPEVVVDEAELPALDLFDMSELEAKPKDALERRASRKESVRRRRKIEEVKTFI